MSLKLLSPGKRKNNKNWIIIGRINGQKIEKSTSTNDRSIAQQILDDFLETHKKSKKFKSYVSFGYAAERLMASRPNLSEYERKRIGLICLHIGQIAVMDVVHDDIYHIASIVYGDRAKPSTKNRYIITPASMVLNYAASNEWRLPIKIKRFKEGAIKPRYISDTDEKILMDYVRNDEDKLLFIMWLFRQGDRVTDSVGPSYEECDLKLETYKRHIGKSDKYDEVPLDPDICEILRKRVKKGARGKIFHWQTRWGPSKWLRETCRKLGVHITPHMCRHTLGKRLNDSGAGLKTIMQILGQTDPRSAIRYQTTGIEELRAAKSKTVGLEVGIKTSKRKKRA